MAKQKSYQRLQLLLSKHFEAAPERLMVVTKAVLDSYLQAERRYHGLWHLQHCLKELDELPDLAIDRDLIELALWYHDVVYVPGGEQDNEILSAQWMMNDLSGLATDLNLNLIQEMIFLSKHNQAPVSDINTQIFLDIDLSILGQSPDVYREYMKRVREEYYKVPLFIFRERRNKFLKHLLREGIYYSPYFIEKYEMLARRNIRAELQQSLLLQP